MPELTDYQREALDAYFDLMRTQPNLFGSRIRRPIVRNREILEAYADGEGTVLGLAARTPYVYFIVDLVESRPGTDRARMHPYLRVVMRNQLIGARNVVVLGTIENAALGEKGSIVLLKQERHATGSVELELPRGFGEPNLSGEANALRELQEETGFIGTMANYMGSTFTDSGMTDAEVFFYHVPIAARSVSAADIEETMVDIKIASLCETWELIKNGTIRDAFTLQALYLFEKNYTSL